jgi:hypothetical protein
MREREGTFMRPIIVAGGLLIALGIAGLVVDNITFTERVVVIDSGPIKVTEDRQPDLAQPDLAMSTIAGIAAIAAGAAMIFIGRDVKSQR